MCQNPPSQNQPTGRRRSAFIPRKTTILLIRRGLKPGISAESGWPKLWHSSWCPPIGPYSELKLVLPSKTPATADNGFVSSMRRAG
jgi:hypothetical protein